MTTFIGRREFIRCSEAAMARRSQQGRSSRRCQWPGCSVARIVKPASQLNALWRGLKKVANVGEPKLAIEYRWAEGRLDGLPTLAADLFAAEWP